MVRCDWVMGDGMPCGRDTGSFMFGNWVVCAQHQAELERCVSGYLATGRRRGQGWGGPIGAFIDQEADRRVTRILMGARREEGPDYSHSLVYFATRGDPHAGDLVKIGRTVNLAARMKALDTTALATMPGGPSEEAELHRRFADHRVRGEWFTPAPPILEFIAAL